VTNNVNKPFESSLVRTSMTYTERIISQIQKLTGQQQIILTSRCNAAILLALKVAKQLGYSSVTIPDWGGWMTYEQFATKLKLPVHKIKTDDGQIDAKELKLTEKTILLLHSLAGYHWRLDTKEIAAAAKRDGALFVEDICGSIGDGAETYGDIVVCSFGAAKPVNFGTGGFFATNTIALYSLANALLEPIDPETFDQQSLLDKLTPLNLSKRRTKLFTRRDEMRLLFEKAGFVCDGDSSALVLIVPYSSESQKAAIIGICAASGIEYTECPRYIRSGKRAISVEIKRL